MDPQGYALMPRYFAPYINVELEIDPSFNGVFSMQFDESAGYTHKSQYLQHCSLTGTNPSHLIGNALYNRLKGNDADNILEGGSGNDCLDGRAGIDIARYVGTIEEYSIEDLGGSYLVRDGVVDRDGVDTLKNIEIIRFVDGEISVATNTEEVDAEEVFDVFPNPTSRFLSIKRYDSKAFRKGEIYIIDFTGKIVLRQPYGQQHEVNQLDLDDIPPGKYVMRVLGGDKSSSRIIIKQ